MKRGFSNVDDDSPTANQQPTKYSRNPNNARKLTFQINDSLRDAYGSPSVESKIKAHQSTPYPKLRPRQLQDEEDEQDESIIASAIRPDRTAKPTTETVEKRNPEYLNKICSLNRSFIRWIDTYFNKGDNFDFTPVCNDYIRFMNRLKEKYPNENGDASLNDKSAAVGNCRADSSPIKNKSTGIYQSLSKFVSTPPPNPGDPGYKSTPHPKNLLKQQQPAAAERDTKFGAFGGKLDGEEENTVRQQTAAKFEFLPQPQTNEDKKDEKFSFLPTGTSASLTTTTTTEFALGRNQMGSNAISKNLFDIKPKLSNSSPLQLPFSNDTATLAAKPTDNHFSADGFFKTQIANQSVSKGDLTDPNMTANTTANDTINDDDYVPPKPESVAHVEEDAKYSVKCKLFLKKEASYIEKGLGTLYIKETNEEAGNQLLIRADNSLGTIMMNIRLNKSLPIISTKSGLLLTIPNIPSSPVKGKEPEPETASYYIKVKNNEIRDELNAQIKSHSV